MKTMRLLITGAVLLMLWGCPGSDYETKNDRDKKDRDKKKTEMKDKSEMKDKTLEGDFKDKPFSLPALPYKAGALEPHIDWKTMKIHHQRHHRGYVRGLNNAVEGTEAAEMTLTDIMRNISNYDKAVRNSGGGHYNHKLFWKVMSPDGGGNPEGELLEAIEAAFGSAGHFRKQFNEAAGSLFGSGWAWLSVDKDGNLFISTTPNQDNPLMDVVEERGTPILGLDLWEHAYYLNYQNERNRYIEAFWSVVNWEEVSRRYQKALDKDDSEA